jgi:hypothetical protein
MRGRGKLFSRAPKHRQAHPAFAKAAHPMKGAPFAISAKKQEEGNGMQLLLSHWHCILPIAGVALAALFMLGKPKGGDSQTGDRSKK